jgi:hypothetical protein
VQGIKREIFREPRQGAFYWVLVLLGCADFAYGLFSSLSSQARPLILAVSLMILLMGAAEVLPRSRTILAGLLRIGSIVAILFMVIVVIEHRLFG